MNDLLQATGYAAIVYLLFNYLISFGSGRPLVEWINPGRKYLPLLAFALVGGAYGSFRVAVARYHMSHLELIHKLLSEEKAPPEVIGAVSFVIFALALLMLAGWCWWFLPRAPQTFSPNPRDLVAEYRRALRHYVRWRGGLDFAALCEVRSGQLRVIAEGSSDRQVLSGLTRLPGLHSPADGRKEVEGQKQRWRELAAEVFARWSEFGGPLAPARQGVVVGLAFDLRYGALFTEVIEEETGPNTAHPVGLVLLAATLNQHEVTTLTAARHFSMLSQAIRHIRSGVTKG